MTQEQRIENLEYELSNLREELKRNRKANVWNKVKGKFSKEINSFDWVDEWSFTNSEGKIVKHNTDVMEAYHIAQAIGTIVRIVLKRRRLNYIEESDEEKATNITKQILEIMKNEREVNQK